MRIFSNNGGWKMRVCLRRKRDDGFTYLGLMIVVTVMGIMLATVGEVWHLALKREKEQELLFVGSQFRRALALYYEHTPPNGQRYPSSLEDLLHDPRHAEMQRYLRKIYVDPMTGSPKWGLIKGPNGEIFGVYSLSEEEPLKKSHFKLMDKNLEGKTKYSEWVFVHLPGQRFAQPL